MTDIRKAVDAYFSAFAGIWNGTSTPEDVNALKSPDCVFALAPASFFKSMPTSPGFGTNEAWVHHIRMQQPIVDSSTKLEVKRVIIDAELRTAVVHMGWDIKLKTGVERVVIENAVFLDFEESSAKIKKVTEFTDTAESKWYMDMMMQAAQQFGQSQTTQQA
jgi:hypothetical protein